MENLDQKSAVCDYEVVFLCEKEESVSILTRILGKYGIKSNGEKPAVKINSSYPIQKQTLLYIGVLFFSCEPEIIQKFSDDLRLTDEISRFMIRRVEKKNNKEKTEVSNEIKDRKERKRKIASPKTSRKNLETVLTNEALQEKIEEILQ